MPSTPTIDTARLATLAQSYEADIVQFLRDLIAIPGESGNEGPVIQRIRQEMEKVGFDEVRIDPMGNILGRIGSGKTHHHDGCPYRHGGRRRPQGMGLGPVPGQS